MAGIPVLLIGILGFKKLVVPFACLGDVLEGGVLGDEHHRKGSGPLVDQHLPAEDELILLSEFLVLLHYLEDIVQVVERPLLR